MTVLPQGCTWTDWIIRCIPWSRRYFRTTIHSTKTTMLPFTQLELYEGELQHHPWPAESPDLNITEPFCSVLETWVRNRFPSTTSLKKLKDVLQDEWNNIPLEAVQNLCESIPRRTTDILKEKVVQRHVNKEMFIVSVLFQIFCPIYRSIYVYVHTCMTSITSVSEVFFNSPA
jgi:hypothetical protein